MGEGIWGVASECDFCFVVDLVAVLPLVTVLPRVAGFEVFAVVLPIDADLAVVSGSTVGCGVASGWAIGSTDI